MRKLLLTLLLMNLPLGYAADETGAPTLGEGMVNPGFHEQPAWFKQSFLDIREDIAEAAAEDRRVMLYFYQDGCPYCKKLLETNFSQRDIVERTRRHFDVIAINMWGDREVLDFQGTPVSEKQFAADLKVQFTPTLVLLDEDAEVVLRLNGYYPPHKFAAVVDYVGQRKERDIGFRDYWAAQAPREATGRLHTEVGNLPQPYRLAGRRGGRPLLVLFEQRDCAPCDELHLDILKRPESAELLAQFDVVVLDMWSDTQVEGPDGKQRSAARWSRELNVQYAPSMLIFDADGREVFRTEAYLKAFHMQSAMDYILSGAYREQPSFQRFVQTRADALEARGIHVDLMQ